MRIAILALQGAFAEHEQMLHSLGVETFEIRQRRDWDQPKDGLIIPGGESTTQSKLLRELGLYEPIKKAIAEGLPVFGTCAGLIQLDRDHLGTMNIVAERNAYGRQLGSFYANSDFKGLGEVPMTFIRAPYIKEAGKGVELLAEVDGRVVAAREGNQLVTAFHPEVGTDTRIHSYFLHIVEGRRAS